LIYVNVFQRLWQMARKVDRDPPFCSAGDGCGNLASDHSGLAHFAWRGAIVELLKRKTQLCSAFSSNYFAELPL
jgi:hypothetical protein